MPKVCDGKCVTPRMVLKAEWSPQCRTRMTQTTTLTQFMTTGRKAWPPISLI